MRKLIMRTQLQFQALEDRSVPSVASPDVDLTTRGATGTIDGAIFRQFDAQPTGTGVIDSFVRLQAKGAHAQVEQGFNTDARPLQFDENKSPQFTRSLRLSDIPVVNIGGVLYREFLLDINQKAVQPFLSLDSLKLFVANAPNLTGYNAATGQLAGLDAVFDMDAGGDHFVKLDGRLNQGSGKGDMLLYLPNSLFADAGANAFVYLFSRFGDNFMGNAGFEEWAVASAPLTCTHGSISGTVRDASGLGLQDVVVFLDVNGNGVLDGDEIFTTTDANGNYQFLNLAAGLGDLSTYRVQVLPPPDFNQPSAALISLTDCGDQVLADFVLVRRPPDS